MHYDHVSQREIVAYVDKTVANLKLNNFVLSPLLKLMRENDRTLPSLDRLIEQMGKVYECSRVRVEKHGDRLYQESWGLRRLCVLPKKEFNRPNPPKDRDTYTQTDIDVS